MNKDEKKALARAYKEQKEVGGVCAICCRGSGKRLIKSGADLKSMRNRYDTAVAFGSCMQPVLQGDWKAYGPEAFSFEVLEQVERREDQSGREFREELRTLEELWRERYRPEELY